MENLRNLLATGTLMATLMIGASTANAGILMSDLSGGGSHPCTENTDKKDWGVIVYDLGGVIVYDLTGVIVYDAADHVDCGILMTD